MSGATEWIRHRGMSFAQHFGLRRAAMPCQTTYSNVLALVDGNRLDELVCAFFVRWEAASVDVETNPVVCRRHRHR